MRRVAGHPDRHPGGRGLDDLTGAGAAAGLLEGHRQPVAGLVQAAPDQQRLLLITEPHSPAGEELGLGGCPARLGVDQQAVDVEHDRRRPRPQQPRSAHTARLPAATGRLQPGGDRL